MREIKFRAWGSTITNNRKHIFTPAVDGFNCLNVGIDNLQAIGIVIMQYTGLKDKNEASQREVYEHDILYDGKGKYYKVEWDYRNTGWRGINTYNNNKKNLVELLLAGSIVVGNIYENQELLR